MSTNITAAGFILLNFNLKENKWKVFCLVDNEGLYDFPKGVIDEGESILEAAKRELFEETNIDINNQKVFKTWVNWDSEWEELKEESLDNISIQGSTFESSLRLFFAEVEESIIDEVKILPNPYTNIKEHINYRFIDKEEFESDNTPDYLRESFDFVLNKIRLLGEERGFNNVERGKY